MSLDAGIGKATRFSVELAIAGCHEDQMEGQSSKRGRWEVEGRGGEQGAEGTEQQET